MCVMQASFQNSTAKIQIISSIEGANGFQVENLGITSSKRDMLLTSWKPAKGCLEFPAFIENSKLMNGKILIIKYAFIILILGGKNTYNAISEFKVGL